ncbi:sucrose phosphorylase [Opitutaceae bacterium EW11]|nr:sucrose phosphorylase [Opitutaceae bacterium EW11]
MKNQVQLITYVDRLSGGGLAELRALLDGPLAGLFGGVHLLPFFHAIDGADAGFDPIDHLSVDRRLGDWGDIRELSAGYEVMADLIVNHVSAASPQFEDFYRHGDASRHAGLFLTFDDVFPRGATEGDLLKIYRPRPGLPFSTVTLRDGSRRVLWTTFTSQQLDINVRHPEGQAYLRSILERFRESGVRSIRLDATGYAIKKAGTGCFMIPETYAFIAELTAQARAMGIEVLVEIHSYYRRQVEIAAKVDRVYDFALPPLVLHTLFTGNARALKSWLAISPRNAITVLDTHDGIGVIDVGADPANPAQSPGLLSPSEIDALVETMHTRSQGQSRQATGAAASNLDLYQVNCTYYDALGGNDRDYLWARAIQFFAPGIPQVYYVGLLATKNDMELLRRTGVGRDINRHHYRKGEAALETEKPVVRALFDLIRFRNRHPSFGGDFKLVESRDESLMLQWTNGAAWSRLTLDFTSGSGEIRYSIDGAAPTAEGKIVIAV